ncbi:hypothetical protein [Yinghuangia seranimata]|uniref:Orn/Lys/Arg family decarboxylase n=1 Tax=Yinghuangia seranimata TaxID=408067 RepID=UPI00248C686A|nr:hypothetical protein [Yinghuangia seranimata]MDI2125405.1 hypothetical protein [Yinghuangia seranimata]
MRLRVVTRRPGSRPDMNARPEHCRAPFLDALAAHVPADKAAGRIAAEMITPYPPGIPVVLPGERISGAVLDYLRSRAEAGMVLPDADDDHAESIRVVVES